MLIYSQYTEKLECEKFYVSQVFSVSFSVTAVALQYGWVRVDLELVWLVLFHRITSIKLTIIRNVQQYETQCNYITFIKQYW